MQQFNELFDLVMAHEGFYANVTGDQGGETYMGISRRYHPNWQGWNIIDNYKKEHGNIKHNQELKTPGLRELVKDFYYHTFYHTNKLNHIENKSLKYMLFDWLVNSGAWAAKGLQKVLNTHFQERLIVDGVIGKQTLRAINKTNPNELFEVLKRERISFYKRIAKKGQNKKFLKGWLKRVDQVDSVA